MPEGGENKIKIKIKIITKRKKERKTRVKYMGDSSNDVLQDPLAPSEQVKSS